jgi:hypothetical protein
VQRQLKFSDDATGLCCTSDAAAKSLLCRYSLKYELNGGGNQWSASIRSPVGTFYRARMRKAFIEVTRKK